MIEKKTWPEISWTWLILAIFAFAQLIALLEIVSVIFFDSLAKLMIKDSSSFELGTEFLLDTFRSKAMTLNLVTYGAGAALISLLIFLVWFFSRKRGKDLAGRNSLLLCIGMAALLVFFLEISCVRIFTFAFPWVKKYGILPNATFGFLVFVGVVLLTKEGVKKYGWEVGFILGTGILEIFCLIQAFFIGLTSRGNFSILGLAIGAVLLIFSLLLLLGIWLGRENAKRAWVWRAEKFIMLCFLLFGLWMGSVPLQEWGKILLWDKVSNLQFSKPERRPGLPNIILIVWDTVRADHLSLYGYSRQTTPFLDQLAENSVVFERAYAPSPWTLSSHASFFTGLYSSEHHYIQGHNRLTADYTTLAEKLKENGYVTLAYSNNQGINRSSGLNQGFDRFVECPQMGFFTGELLDWSWLRIHNPKLLQDSGTEMTNRLLDLWLERLSRQKAPFFIFINYMEAHLPYPSVEEAFHFITDPVRARKINLEIINRNNWNNYICQIVSNEVRTEIVNLYDGTIYYSDKKLSQFYSKLEKTNLLNNTILIVLSDHGELLGEHRLFGHGFFLYEPLLRVPFLIYYPRLVKPTRVKKMVSLTVLPKVIFSLSNNRIPEEMLDSEAEAEPIFAEASLGRIELAGLKKACPNRFDINELDRYQKAVIQWPYKLIWDSTDQDELYNIVQDQEELVNLVNQERQTYMKLNHLINLFRLKYPEPQAGEHPPSIDFQTRKALEALGYLK